MKFIIKPQMRNPNPRGPKGARNWNFAGGLAPFGTNEGGCPHNPDSDFGVRISFGLRISRIGFLLKSAFLVLVLVTLAGCASSGMVQHASPITAQKPFELDVILVTTSSSLKDVDAEKTMLKDALISDLRDTQMFQLVSENKAEVGTGSGIKIDAGITAIKKVSKTKRLWAGAMAGRARIQIRVLVTDLNSGGQIESFEAEGESSGGSALAGTTGEAIERAAGEAVREVLKINSQTAR